MSLKWTGRYRDQRAGEWRVFSSAGAWTLQRDGKRVSRHDSREAAMRKAGRNAATRKAKRHRHVFIPTTATGNATNVDDPAWIKMECDCRSIKMLGPSNDAPAEVQIEMRAVELSNLAGSHADGTESRGWLHHARERSRPDLVVIADHTSHRWIAGYLGREINTHYDHETRDANAWAWDITRPVAGQYEERLDRQAEIEEARAAVNTSSLVAALDSGANAYHVINDAMDAADDADARIAEQTRHDVAASVARHSGLGAESCESCASSDGCEAHRKFTCASCGTITPWSDGADDDGFDQCSDCWAVAHVSVDQIQPQISDAPVLPPLTSAEEIADLHYATADDALLRAPCHRAIDAMLADFGLVRFDVETEEDLGGEA